MVGEDKRDRNCVDCMCMHACKRDLDIYVDFIPFARLEMVHSTQNNLASWKWFDRPFRIITISWKVQWKLNKWSGVKFVTIETTIAIMEMSSRRDEVDNGDYDGNGSSIDNDNGMIKNYYLLEKQPFPSETEVLWTFVVDCIDIFYLLKNDKWNVCGSWKCFTHSNYSGPANTLFLSCHRYWYAPFPFALASQVIDSHILLLKLHHSYVHDEESIMRQKAKGISAALTPNFLTILHHVSFFFVFI